MVKKLGIRENYVIRLVNPPDNYFELTAPFPEGVKVTKDTSVLKDMIHYFTNQISELRHDIEGLRNEIKPNGMIWVSWPKKASKISRDITEDLIRNLALESGLVDIKVCAVDEVWSGLKLVIRVKDRK